MKRSRLNPWLIIALVGGVIYPPLVYYGMLVLPPTVLVFFGLALLGLRLWGVRRSPEAKMWQVTFLIAAIGLMALLMLDAKVAVQAYPVIISLSVASVFGLSLLFPPTLVERIARITEPALSSKGVVYTRNVTAIWTVALLVNASISIATSLWGTTAQWALWNGLISYLMMGTLFVGEWCVRKRVQR